MGLDTAHLIGELIRCNGIEHDTIQLPEVQIPLSEEGDYVDQWFSVENLSDMPLDLHIGMEIDEDVVAVVDCFLKSGE